MSIAIDIELIGLIVSCSPSPRPLPWGEGARMAVVGLFGHSFHV